MANVKSNGKNITAVIVGDGVRAKITSTFIASSAKRKSPRTKHCAVLIVTVKEGKLLSGGESTITERGGERKPIVDNILRIELENKNVEMATPGQSVGICLLRRSIKEVLPVQA